MADCSLMCSARLASEYSSQLMNITSAMPRHEVYHLSSCLPLSLPLLPPTFSPFLPLSRSVSTTVDPFRDISLDLAPSMVTNRTSTPVETNGQSSNLTFFLIDSTSGVWMELHFLWPDIQSDRASPASSTTSGETLLSAVPSTLYECLDRYSTN